MHHEGTTTTKLHEGRQVDGHGYRSQEARARADAVSGQGVQPEASHRVDLVVEGLVVVELKSVESLEPIHDSQLLTYLRLSRR